MSAIRNCFEFHFSPPEHNAMHWYLQIPVSDGLELECRALNS